MPLAGDGAIAIWHDVPTAIRSEYFEWHVREHIPERVAIPGFRRGRRFVAINGAPELFTLYETDGPQINNGLEYLHRLNNPTEWTRKIAPQLVNNIRSLCKVELSLGDGDGGLAMVFRFDLDGAAEQATRRMLVREALPEIAARPGIAAVHLLGADRAASQVQTEEKKSRPTQALVPDWVVVVEGAGDRALIESACTNLLYGSAAVRDLHHGLYQLQFCRTQR